MIAVVTHIIRVFNQWQTHHCPDRKQQDANEPHDRMAPVIEETQQ